MRQYRKYNWPALLAKFEQSDLNQTEFAKEKGINAKYLSQKLKEAKDKNPKSFTKVKVETNSATSTGLILEVGRCKIHCPDNMPLTSLATLVHSLA